MFIKLRLFAITITLIFSLNSTITKAQSTDVDPVQLVDYTIVDELIFSVPDDWLVWARSDFETIEEVDETFRDFVEFLFDSRPAGSLGDSPLYFYAVNLTSDNNILVLVRLEVYELDVLATTINLSPEDVTPEYMMQVSRPATLVNRTYGVSQINERSVAYGAEIANSLFNYYTFVSFPDQNKVVQILTTTSENDWFLDNLYLMTVITHSVRLESETIDVESTQRALGEDFPDHILLPVADDSEETVEAEADDDAEVSVDCTVSASNNANLRGGPGTSFAVAGSLTGGTSIAAIGQATGSDGRVWWQLENNSWVRSDVVAEVGDCELLPVIIEVEAAESPDSATGDSTGLDSLDSEVVERTDIDFDELFQSLALEGVIEASSEPVQGRSRGFRDEIWVIRTGNSLQGVFNYSSTNSSCSLWENVLYPVNERATVRFRISDEYLLYEYLDYSPSANSLLHWVVSSFEAIYRGYGIPTNIRMLNNGTHAKAGQMGGISEVSEGFDYSCVIDFVMIRIDETLDDINSNNTVPTGTTGD